MKQAESNGVTNSDIKLIPEDWEVKTLGELCVSIIDGTHETPRYVNNGVPFYSVENITENNFLKAKKITEEAYKRYNQRCNPEKGDILLTRIGTLGKTKLINWDVKASIYVSLALLKFKKEFNVEYIYCYTKSRKFVNDVKSNSLLNAVPQKINLKDISKVPIVIPKSREEQQKIASVLMDMDEFIESLERIIDKKNKIKQGMMQQLLTGKLRLPGFTNSWKSEYIKNIAQVTTGSRNTQDKVDNGKYPFYVRSSIIERIDSYSYDEEAILTAGDGVGTGKVFHYVKGKFDVHQRVYKISNFRDDVHGYFFYLYFSNFFQKRIMSMTAKSSVDSVRREMITEMEILLPSFDEQVAISQIISDIEKEICILEKRLSKYKKIKEGMMQQLLTGRIRLV